MKNKIATICMVIMLLFNMVITFENSYEVVGSDDISNGWLQGDVIVYPVTIIDDEWKKLITTTEQIEACQIPRNIIEGLTTEQLLQAVIDYPLSGTLYYDIDMNIAFQNMIERCDALSELLMREDCIEVVIKKYEDYKIPEKRVKDWSDIIDEEDPAVGGNKIIENKELLKLALIDARKIYAIDIMEMIMAYKLEDMNMEGEIHVIDTIVEKTNIKENSELYSNNNQATFFDAVCVETNEKETRAATNKVTLESPSGYKFTVTKSTINKNCDYATWAANVAAVEGATMVSIAEVDFNCHSYAWLSGLYPEGYKHYILETVPEQLYDDPKYKKYKDPTYNGDIVYWNNSRHSGILTNKTLRPISTNDKRVSPLIISKWGGGPIVQHYLNYEFGLESGVTYFHLFK